MPLASSSAASAAPEMTTRYLKWTKECQTVVETLAVVLLLLLNNPLQSEAQIFSDPCKGVDCQKGQCVDSSAFLGFECQCDKGWTKVANITFLSCFIPDCKLNFSCNGSAAPAPAPVLPATAPLSSTDPVDLCLLPSVCGNGDCVGIPAPGFLQLPTYKCNCHPGNFNMFNQTTGPCLPGCNLSGSCPDLNIPIISGPPGPPPAPPGGSAPSPDANEVNGSVCANVDCWKGTCAPAINLPGLPQYKCNCDHGWLNLLNVSFLACGFPNCQVSDPNCGMLNHPPNLTLPSPKDFLNPCTLSVCGEGTCVPTSDGFLGLPSYNCSCNKGASNLLNNKSGVCISDGCIPQCLGLGQGEPQPPSTGANPLGQGPLALSPDDRSSTTSGQRKDEFILGNVITLLIILSPCFW